MDGLYLKTLGDISVSADVLLKNCFNFLTS